MTYPAVIDLLPHRPPMVLLDEVEWFEGASARCRVEIRPDAPLVEEGRVRAIVALEHMAQCTGVCTMLRARQQGRGPMRGYLVGVRDLRLETDFFDVGDVLHVEATLTWDGADIAHFECRVTRAGRQVATASLSVYRRPVPVDERELP